MTQLPSRVRRFAVAAGIVILLVWSAGCGEDEVDLPAAQSPLGELPESSPTPTLGPEEAQAWAEIETRFDAFMETWVKWSAEGSPGGLDNPATAELSEHAGEFLHTDVATDLTELAQDGQVRTGRPEWRDARPVQFDWERTVQSRVVPEAVFEVCVDDSDWVVVDAGSGEPVDAEPGGPHLWTVMAWWAEEREFGPDGWSLTEREVDRSESC